MRAKITRLGADEIVRCKSITNTDPHRTVGSLISEVLNEDDDPDLLDVRCVHRGEVLDVGKTLSDYGIDTYSILQFLIKPKIKPVLSVVVTNKPSDITKALSSLQWVMRCGQFQKLVSNILQRGWIERAVVQCPALGQDPIAYSVFQDEKMLNLLLRDKQTLEEFISAHPCVVPVLQFAVRSVLGPGGDPRLLRGGNHTVGQQDYTIDQDAYGEGEDEEITTPVRESSSTTVVTPYGGVVSSQGGNMAAEGGRAGTSSTGNAFTTPRVDRQQLEAAIAQAEALLASNSTGRTHAYPSQQDTTEVSRNSLVSSTSIASGPRITHAALSQALASAVTAQYLTATDTVSQPSDANPTNPADSGHIERSSTDTVAPEVRWAGQLAQLAEMGITDKATALQALEATGGDLNLAVQILFG
ncbi:unnamed protein product [Calicophoron daubneyi]|uniref:UBA domain-containing protein n=1 Tax=Calicophoron daubneyi TaxID=300641 RepID=A0AAV2TTD9_CALDB